MRTLTVFNDLVNIDKAASVLNDKTDEQYNFLRELQKVNFETVDF